MRQSPDRSHSLRVPSPVTLSLHMLNAPPLPSGAHNTASTDSESASPSASGLPRPRYVKDSLLKSSCPTSALPSSTDCPSGPIAAADHSTPSAM
eukprot:2835781-Rhodomonas_salina.2